MQPNANFSDQTSDAGDSDRAAAAAFYLNKRKRFCLLVGVLLVAIPIICAVGEIIANVVAERTIQYSISVVSRSTLDAFITVMNLQVLIWWAWKNQQSSWKFGVALVALLTTGMIAHSLIAQLDPTYIGGWAKLSPVASMLAVVAFNWTTMAVALMALQLCGSAVRYQFVDQVDTVSDVTLKRVTWSIRGMFAGTLVIALLLALLQWLRGLYAEVVPAGYYPTSDLAHIIWLGGVITSDVLCLYAAAARRLKQRVVGSILIVLLAALIAVFGPVAYWSFVPNYSQSVTLEMAVIPPVVHVLVMTGLHWLVLGYWQRAGYQLRRFA